MRASIFNKNGKYILLDQQHKYSWLTTLQTEQLACLLTFIEVQVAPDFEKNLTGKHGRAFQFARRDLTMLHLLTTMHERIGAAPFTVQINMQGPAPHQAFSKSDNDESKFSF